MESFDLKTRTLSRIENGEWEHRRGNVLHFTPDRIEILARPGERVTGSFSIDGTGEFEGFVKSSDARMECECLEFTGESQIPYNFLGRDTSEGDVIQGEIDIVSNCGEYYLPFLVTVVRPKLLSSEGYIRSLAQFAQLAEDAPDEAAQIFYRTQEFTNLLSGADARYYEAYLGLSAVEGNLSNMYEFLITAGLREGYRSPVEFAQTGEIPSYRMDSRQTQHAKWVVQLMKLYAALRFKKLPSSAWLTESSNILRRMIDADDMDPAPKLMLAQVLITKGDTGEAQYLLEKAQALEYPARYVSALNAYELYISSLITDDDAYTGKVTDKINQLYRSDRSNWRVAWLLLYLSKEYDRSSSLRWRLLADLFDRGTTSPMIYIEAVMTLNSDASMLTKLGDFERQVVLYGARHEALAPEVIEQFVYMASREKQYTYVVFHALEYCYGMVHSNEILSELCSMLIKGNKLGPQYLRWYALAVEQGLPLMRLYEYYMNSVDTEDVPEIPKAVFLYFSYQNTLDSVHSAAMYADLVRRRDELSEVYDASFTQIEQFVTSEILKGHIDRNLAYLYQNFLMPEMISLEVARALSDLIFTIKVETKRKGLCSCIVIDPGADVGRRYSVEGGIAYIKEPVAEAAIIWEDADGNRYMGSVNMTKDKLMLAGRMAKWVESAAESGLYNRYACMRGRNFAPVTADNELRFIKLMDDPGLGSRARARVALLLLEYYYASGAPQHKSEEILSVLKKEHLLVADRAELTKFLILLGKDKQAYDMIWANGPHGIDPKLVMPLASKIIGEQLEYEQDSTALLMASYCFDSGEYDAVTVKYLAEYCDGSTQALRNIFVAAVSTGSDCLGYLCERILVQMLYSGAYVPEAMDIYETYVSMPDADDDVCRAFLGSYAYEYFVHDQVTDRFIFDETVSRYEGGLDVPFPCKLAYLKNCSELSYGAWEMHEQTVRAFLREMLMMHIYLPFMPAFAGLSPVYACACQARACIEYVAEPGNAVYLHYMPDTDDTYRKLELTPVVGCYYVKDFVLYNGETLQYYIMESPEVGDADKLTISGKLVGNNTSPAGKLADLERLRKDTQDAALRRLEAYQYVEFLKGGLFAII